MSHETTAIDSPPTPSGANSSPDELQRSTSPTGEPTTAAAPSPTLLTFPQAQAAFPQVPGHLNAATCGIPTHDGAQTLRRALEDWATGHPDLPSYDQAVIDARRWYAELAQVPASWVAVGSQVSVLVGTVAASLPPGTRVAVPEGEFTSVTFPFSARPDLVVVPVAWEDLIAAVPQVDWVAFSLVQSVDGRVVDVEQLLAATKAHGTRTLVDLTQAGWLSPDASRYDVTVTGGYKWLCTPRGAAFATVRPDVLPLLAPVNAGWYATEDVWGSVYGVEPNLAPDARRLDVSPAWFAWVGAVDSLRLFAQIDREELRDHTVGLANQVLTGLGLPPSNSAIIRLPDPDGESRRLLEAAGMQVAGRGGGVRLSFHLWNTQADVDAALHVLRSSR